MASTNGPYEVGDIRIIEDKAPDYIAMVKATMTDDQARELSDYASRMPEGASPDAILTAWRGGIGTDTDTADAVVVGVDGKLAPKPVPQEEPVDDDFWLKDAAQGVTRVGMAAVSSIGEVFKGTAEAVVGGATGRRLNDGSGWNEVLETTSLWNLAGNWKDQGSGWFLGGEAAENQERQRTDLLYRQVKTKNALGNDVVALVPSSLGVEGANALGVRPGTDAYKWAVGLIDVTSAIALDPLTYGTGGLLAIPKLAKAADSIGLVNKVATKAKMAEVQAEFLGKARHADKGDAIKDILDLNEETLSAVTKSLAARDKELSLLDEAAKTAETAKEAENIAASLKAARLAQTRAEMAKRNATIAETLESDIANIWREAGEGSIDLQGQLSKLEEAVAKATDARIKDLDASIARDGDYLTNLQQQHREAVGLLDQALQPGTARLGDDVAEVLETTREALKPKPGPALLRAQAILESTTSTPAQKAAAARQAEKAAKYEATRAMAAEVAFDKARRAFGLIDARKRLAMSQGDTAGIASARAAEAKLMSHVKMLRWPAETVKDQVNRVNRLNDLTSQTYKQFGEETIDGAKKLADELGDEVTTVSHQMDQASVARPYVEQQILDEAAGKVDDLQRQGAEAREGINQMMNDGIEGATAVAGSKLAASADEAAAAADEAEAVTNTLLGEWKAHLSGVRQAREADAAAAGKVAAEAADEAVGSTKAMLEKMDLLRRTYGLHDEINKLLAGETGPLQQAMEEAMGLSKFDGVDWDKFINTLMGKHGNITIEKLVAEKNSATIWRAMGRKVHPKVADELALAASKDEVLEVLAKAVGAREGITGPLTGFGMKTFRGATGEGMFFTKIQGAFGGKVNDWAYRTYVSSEKTVPWSHEMHLEDVQSVALAVDDWLNMAIGYTARRRYGRDETRTLIDGIVNKVIAAPDMFARREALQNGLKHAAGEMAKANGVSPDHAFHAALTKAFDKAFTTMGDGSRTSSDYLTVAGSLDPTAMASEVNGVRVLDQTVPRHLYQFSELFKLPDIREVQTIIRQGKKFDPDPAWWKEYGQDFMEYRVDKLFRTAVLVFRPAYIIRNLGEAAFRMYLNGSLQDPMTMAAMAMRHSKDRRFWSKLDAYDKDALGRDFRDYAAETNDLTSVDAAMRGSMWRTHSVMDSGFQRRMARSDEVTKLQPGDRNYVEAWRRQLAALRGDQVTVDVVSVGLGKPTKRMSEYAKSIGETDLRKATLQYYSEGPGKAVFERMAVERPGHWGQMLDAAGRTNEDDIVAALKTGRWSIDQKALEQILFTHQGSFFNEARRFTVDFDESVIGHWLDGNADGIHGALKNLSKDKGAARTAEGQTVLPDHVYWLGKTSNGLAQEGPLTRATDKFFHWSAMAEGAANWAPQTRVAYWQKMESLFPYLTKTDQEAVLAGIGKTSPIPFRKYERLVSRLKATSASPKSGMLNRDDVHAMASMHAVEETKKLFYDGFKKKQHWYSMRLLFPFGQAWSNTLNKWSELATKPTGAIRVLALKKGYDAFGDGYMNYSEEEWEARKHELLTDPSTRPLLYKDPGTGSLVFDVPIVGKIAETLTGLPSQTIMPLSSLNVATGSGMPLPGFGPVVTMPMKSLFNMTNMQDWTPDWVEKWIEPFPSGVEQGATQMTYRSFMPAWFRRVWAAFDPQFGDQEIQSMVSPITTYLASAHPERYLNEEGVFTPEGANLLSEDVHRMARKMSLFRGFAQAGLPGSALYQWVMEKGDEGEVTQAAAYEDWTRISALNGDDFGLAAKEFEDLYGPGSLLHTLGKYEGDFSPTTKAEAYFKDNESDLSAFPTVAGLFFPFDGVYSPSFDADLRRRDLRVKYTPKEMTDRANQRRYYAVKANLQEKVDLGKMSQEDMSDQMRHLSREFGVTYKDALSPDREAKVRELKKVLESDSALKQTDAGIAAAEYMELREKAQAKLDAAGIKSFENQKAAPLSQYLYAAGTRLVEQHPDFSRMWQSVFESEVA